MARHATPLVAAPALPSADHLEMLVARARLHHQPVGLDASEEPLLTVLLSYDPTETERRAARALAASFIAAECSFESPPLAADISCWLTETLRALPPSAACIVIALPDCEAKAVHQVHGVVEVLRTGHHSTPLMVGVAINPADWPDLNLDGFIVAEPDERATDALRVFSMLAALMAPGLICCLDAEDFSRALGTATNPSKLAEAVYLACESRLVAASCTDEQVLRDASGVAVVPSRWMPLTTQAQLVKRVRACVRPDAAVNLVAPYGLTLEPLGSRGAVEVLLLCRPHAD